MSSNSNSNSNSNKKLSLIKFSLRCDLDYCDI